MRPAKKKSALRVVCVHPIVSRRLALLVLSVSVTSLISWDGTAWASNYSAVVEGDGPSAYWQLNDAGDATAADSSGNNNNGAYSGGVSSNVGDPTAPSGLSGGANFNGSSGYVALPSAAFDYPSGSAETIEAWFKTTSNAISPIFGQNSDDSIPGGQPSGWDLPLYLGSDGKVRADQFYDGVNPIVSTKSYNDGAWHFAVDVVDDGTETLYVDGAEVAQATGRNVGGGYNGGSTSDYAYWLGAGDSQGNWGGEGWSWFAGSLSDAAVYDTALSTNAIEAQYAAAVPEPASLALVGVSSLMLLRRRRA
jgi:hypothetical protein